ncbi:hypothetical protein M408DRAFT_120332 [Serendipita vermifera MAFF 305830]|uniref:U3 small nucleolar RNA-associated protein 10 n=1 Tax=Serendipita vermifera MAFF 305830 TaxID=933852 RepID=A0A0C3AXF1_SERVB|nr:hypothetical protein M408DRAFT_120332 [Serendipita vermifera MAFF 305830]
MHKGAPIGKRHFLRKRGDHRCWQSEWFFGRYMCISIRILKLSLALLRQHCSRQSARHLSLKWLFTTMLAAQLEQSASLNAQFLKTHKNVESYLFSPQQARQHDIDAIFQLAQNGLHLLATSSKQIKSLNSPLFASSAKFTDRTSLAAAENASLDVAIEKLLFALAPYLMEQAASKIIEWLVRRYRVNEFNVEALLTIFLPYHATPHFIKLLSILHIPQGSAWTFLAMHKKALAPLHRETILKEMLSNALFAKAIVNILQKHVAAQAEHRAVVGFSLAITLQYIKQATLDSVVLAFLLPGILTPLADSHSADTGGACLVLLAHLSQHVAFTSDALPVILDGLAPAASRVEPTNLLTTLSLILQHQEALESLPKHLTTALLGVQNLPGALNNCQQWLVTPKVLRPLAAGFCAHLNRDSDMEDESDSFQDSALAALDALFTFKPLSLEGATALCAGVLQNWPRDSAGLQEKLLKLLRRAYQLFPEAPRLAVNKLESDDMEALEDELQGIIDSVTMLPGEAGDGHKNRDASILASSSDAPVRARGVRALLDADGVAEGTPALLLSTMEDNHTEVLHALYSEPEKLIEILGADAVLQRIERLLQPQSSKTMSIDVMCTHVDLLASLVGTGKRDVGMILFGHLLVTKAGFKRSAAVWGALEQRNVLSSDLLKGASSLAAVDWKGMKGDQATMTAFNERLVQLIAGNLITLSRYEAYIEFLLTQATEYPASTSAALALLVLYNVLNSINGSRKLELGIRLTQLVTSAGLGALQSVETKSINEGDMKRIDFSRIVSKPEHLSTHGRLYAAILLLLPVLSRVSSRMNWFPASGYTEGQSVIFSRALYILLNRSAAAPNLCTLVLRGLFLSLQDDTLLLLASIWSDISVLPGVRVAALKHAQAFIRALLDPSAESISKDLQIVFPFLVGVIYDANQGIRDAAVVCIQLIAGVRREKGTNVPEVYALKSIPEEISAIIKLLEWLDFLRYAKALAAHAETLKVDAGVLISVHEDILQIVDEDSGKDSRYKRRILSYLLSHVAAWPSSSLRLALLACTSSIQDTSKLSLVASLIEELSKVETDIFLAGLEQEQQQVYVNSLLSAFNCADSSAVGPLFPALLELVRRALSNKETERALHGASSVIKTMGPSLPSTQKLEICHLLLSLADPVDQTNTLELLAVILDDEETLVTLLKQLRPISADEQPSKRPRRETSDIDPLVRLNKVCQALSLSSPDRSLAALSALLESLDAILDARGVENAELAHIQQVIMNALSHTSQCVTASTVITSQLRIDVLVKLVKDSANPQIVHQALLVIAALAPWSSDSLLHHLMPILLSTGNYISPREDVYSARVAEKTIDSVIPVLTSHLRSQYGKKGQLQIAARPYLDVFVDAAGVIPSHRRTSFFIHLVSILGPSDFLNPICVLLLEPSNSSDGNTKKQADQVSLVVSIMQARPLESRLAAIAELLEEMVADMSAPQLDEPWFLSSLKKVPNETGIDRITVIMDMIYQTLQRSRGVARLGNDESPQRILAALVRLLALENHRNTAAADHFRQHLTSTIKTALRLVSASTMLFTCLQLLRSNDLALQIELYSLLGTSLPDVNADIRSQMSSDIVLLVKIIKEHLVTSQSPLLFMAAMKALQAVTKTAQSTELSALTETVSIVTNSLQISQLSESCIQALQTLCITLGPRIIPQLASVIESCSSLMHRPESSEKLFSTSTGLLRHLLDSASSFWTSASAEAVLLVYITRSTAGKERDKAAMNSLGKHMARKLPTQVFIPALGKTWKRVDAERNTTSQVERNAIFIIMKQAIKNADRALITAEARLLLNIMMEAWDGSMHMEDNAPSIKAFVELVIKLNEASFKPLYRIMFDWAWTPDHESTVFSLEHRAIAYCQAMGAILGTLKGLVTPYMAPFVGRAAEALDLWSQAPATFALFELWRKIVGLIKQGADVDDGAFWRDEFIRLISPSLVRQIHIASSPQHPWMASLLADTLGAIAKVAVDDGFLKALNIDIFMITREDIPKTRICALECASKLWMENGRRLAGWKHETVPFLHECAEDENEDVAARARRLKSILDQF